MSAGAVTRELAAYAARSRFDDLPAVVQDEAVRAFVNWMGCVLGGCGEEAVAIAASALAASGARPQASLIGHGRRSDLASAALVNCLSSSALAFDDTHLATVTHPTGPVAAVVFALAEGRTVSGAQLLHALAVGIEIQCRMSNALLVSPARSHPGFYITGLTGPIGAAAALGNLLGLDERRMASALGLAAAQGCGFRATHGAMAGSIVPAFAARGGATAALLAEQGFTCPDNALEASNGFLDVFAEPAAAGHAVDGLGSRFELLANAYKPYPCGIVIHAAIDACLELAGQLGPGGQLAGVSLRVNPLALSLADRRAPRTTQEAQVSLYHWAAVALLRGRAGVAECRTDTVEDAPVKALRQAIRASADPALGRDEAVAEATLADGRVLRAHVTHARGSQARPLTDEELDAKFLAQAALVVPERARAVLRACRGIAALDDVGQGFAGMLP